MDSKTIANGILRALAILVGVALLLYFLYQIRVVITYILVAAVVSLIGRPLIIFLRRRLKFGNTTAVVVTMGLMIGVLAGLIALFVPLILQQGKNLALVDINQLEQNIETLYADIIVYFENLGIDFFKTLKDLNLLEKLNLSLLPDFFNGLIGALGNFTVGFASVIFISFFFLKDSQLFERGMLMFVPTSKEDPLKNSWEKIKNLLSRYFLGLLLQIFILFIIYTIVLLIFGVKNAIIIALLCALLNLIPYVGPLIGGILMALLTMSSFLGESFSDVILPKTIYVLIGFAIGQAIDNNLTVPLVFSKSVKSHPLEIFLIIIIGGLLFGITGMVVAVPAYTAIKVILKEFLAENKIVKSLTKNI